MTPRRFPRPWTAEGIPGGWRVRDGNGVTVAYVYGREKPTGVNDKSLTMDEARRIATQIARLPELLLAAKDE